jgi:hypothetical protein
MAAAVVEEWAMAAAGGMRLGLPDRLVVFREFGCGDNSQAIWLDTLWPFPM